MYIFYLISFLVSLIEFWTNRLYQFGSIATMACQLVLHINIILSTTVQAETVLCFVLSQTGKGFLLVMKINLSTFKGAWNIFV